MLEERSKFRESLSMSGLRCAGISFAILGVEGIRSERTRGSRREKCGWESNPRPKIRNDLLLIGQRCAPCSSFYYLESAFYSSYHRKFESPLAGFLYIRRISSCIIHALLYSSIKVIYSSIHLYISAQWIDVFPESFRQDMTVRDTTLD